MDSLHMCGVGRYFRYIGTVKNLENSVVPLFRHTFQVISIYIHTYLKINKEQYNCLFIVIKFNMHVDSEDIIL